MQNADKAREEVRDHYGQIARGETRSCCGPTCCGPEDASKKIGYSDADVTGAPTGSNLGLGCGNPQGIASLKRGETVLDLGSGAGFDCFLAAKQVGPGGKVIGVDMTPSMLSKARAHAREAGTANVEFRLGEIEHLPVEDASVDVVMSNCVINLSPDKPAVFREAFRVLRKGGRVAIADIVALRPLPDALRTSEAFVGCVAGAALVDDVQALLRDAGFSEIRVRTDEHSADFLRDSFPGTQAQDYVASALIEAKKA